MNAMHELWNPTNTNLASSTAAAAAASLPLSMQKLTTKTRVARKRRNERNTLTFYEKIAVIRYHEQANLSRQKLALMFHCCATQIRRVLESKDQLLQQLTSISEKDASFIVEEMTHKRRKFEMRAIGFLLHQWVERCRQYRISIRITNQTLKTTALKMAALLNLPAFRPTYRWLQRFRSLYKYDEEFDLGCSGPGTNIGEVPVEDIIIEFRESLPGFMKQEITSITDNNNHAPNPSASASGVQGAMAASLRDAMRYPEVLYNSSNENSRDREIYGLLTGQQELNYNNNNNNNNSLNLDENIVEIGDDDEYDEELQVPDNGNYNDDSQPDNIVDEDDDDDDVIVLPDAMVPQVEMHQEHNEEPKPVEPSEEVGQAVLASLFPHLAILHQFTLRHADAKALELISQLGMHIQTQALMGVYDNVPSSAGDHNAPPESAYNREELSYANFDDIQLIE